MGRKFCKSVNFSVCQPKGSEGRPKDQADRIGGQRKGQPKRSEGKPKKNEGNPKGSEGQP